MKPSNSGSYSRDRFVAIPHLSADLGYQLTNSLKTYVGYDLVYWEKVVRAGQQIATTLDAPARPQLSWNESTFWAQGLRAGAEFRY